MSGNRREFVAGACALGVAGQACADAERWSPVVELRQYTLRRNQRDVLIRLFEREFVESQEVVGARIIGTFRDLDDPDRFVWLRGFASMEARARALGAFYGGPVWAANRNQANPTMLDSDNVLLLHPAEAGSGFQPMARDGRRAGLIVAQIHYLDEALSGPFADFFEATVRPGLEADGARSLAAFVSETSPNNFPKLPIRASDRVFIWFARFESEEAFGAFQARRRRLSGWRDAAPESLLPAFMRKPEVLRLAPTARSALR